MKRVVVVGDGMAGARLAFELRELDPRCHITLFGAEPTAAYNRILLSDLLAGKIGEAEIGLAEPAGVIDRRDGVAVTAIDRHSRAVLADDGSKTHYDALVLATGSIPAVPPIAGLTDPGEHPDAGRLVDGAALFRNVADCRRILALAERAKRAVVLGGGLLGLEAARGLAMRGLEVEVLHARRHLMERQLDPAASRVLIRTLRDFGVSVRLSAVTEEVLTDAAGRLCGVVLDDDTTVPADLMVIACGVRPDTGLAQRAGLDIGRGVIVDDRMRTSDPAIFAIGDCAEHRGTVYGLVAPAWEQARVAAEAINGGEASYAGSRIVTRLKAAGVDVASMGDPHIDAETDASAEVVTFADPARATYHKVVIRDRRLIGAIMIGDNTTVGTVTQLFDRGTPVSGDPRSLLFGGSGGGASVTSLSAGSTVCRCNGVTAGSIVRAWMSGARSIAEVAAVTRAGTGCGSCRDTIAEFLAHLDAEASAPTGEVVA